MILEKGLIPPNSNFELTNPSIDTELLRIKVIPAYNSVRKFSYRLSSFLQKVFHGQQEAYGELPYLLLASAARTLT